MSKSIGVVTVRSQHAFEETLQLLIASIKARGMKVFLDLDQQAEAQSDGVSMPKAHLLLFGRPRSGTQILLEYPEAGIDVPLKAYVWEAEDGGARVSYASPHFIAERYSLPKSIEALFGVVSLVAEAVVPGSRSSLRPSRSEIPAPPF
jgi:uncharacterized protein (DUF302 family)